MVDFASVRAIDFHTHAEEPCCDHRDDGYNEFQAGMAAYFKNPAGAKGMLPTVQDTANYYRERNIAAVIFPVDAERETGFRRYSNEEVAGICAENDDILIPFASVDPHKGKAGAREVRRLVRLKYSNPMYLDDVAVDFPDMKIILAHPSFPWTEEGLAVAQHKPNVYYDMSGWSPKYFPETFIRYANSILKKKMLFGSDWPAITPDRWLADFEAAPFKDEVRPLILKENAMRLLGETV